MVNDPQSNVIAELDGTEHDNVVMAGAHLDSVPAGPGINDNGSGSAALMNSPQQIAKLKPENTLRFAWWGAEEEGLIGSTAYVDDLSQAERDRIALYMNFDMMARRTTSRWSTTPTSRRSRLRWRSHRARPDRGRLRVVLHPAVGEPYDDSAFDGRSDYQAFIENGIPSGGLFTGAEEEKTDEQQAIWGGTAGGAVRPV